MNYLVCEMVHVKDPANRKEQPMIDSNKFSLSLSLSNDIIIK